MFGSVVKWSLIITGFCCPVLVSAERMKVPNFKPEKNVATRNFEGANLAASDFSGVNASGSSFMNGSLNYANLSLANFQNTNLSNVSFRLALIEFTDFTGAEGLTTEQLMEACIPQLTTEEKLGEILDLRDYVMPEACQLWEHISRG